MVGGVSEDSSSDVIETALRDLRYDRVWLSSGLLSIENLLRQHHDFRDNVPWSTDLEHFHVNALHAWLTMRYQLTDAELENALVVLQSQTGVLSTLSGLRLLLSANLRDGQFERVLALACLVGLGSDVAAFQRFAREWNKGVRTAPFLQGGIDGWVAAIHLLLAKQSEAAWVLKALKSHGTSKEVRHVAKQRLQQLGELSGEEAAPQ